MPFEYGVKLTQYAVVLLSLVAVGCATAKPTTPEELQRVQVYAFSYPPIGQVIPVYVAMRRLARPSFYGDHPYALGPYIQEVSAVTTSGEEIKALDIDETIERAGGAARLTTVLTKIDDKKVILQSWANLFGSQPLGVPPGEAIFGLLWLPPYAAYLKSNAEGLQRRKLEFIVFTTSWSSGDSYNHGWVFFPVGQYTATRFEIRDRQRQHRPSEDPTLWTRNVPWKVYSAGSEPWVELGLAPVGPGIGAPVTFYEPSPHS